MCRVLTNNNTIGCGSKVGFPIRQVRRFDQRRISQIGVVSAAISCSCSSEVPARLVKAPGYEPMIGQLLLAGRV